jgi:membrane-bound metal-dependent hydrolase YbcI (DUF457 family)
MAGYREHISVSGLCGAAYGAAASLILGFTPVQSALAGCLTWVAGMLPDLDADGGKPVREIFGLLGAIVPLVAIRHLMRWCGSVDGVVLSAIIIYALTRYGGAAVLKKLSVHRGMFHSIPALLIASELTFLAYVSDSVAVKCLMAGGVGIGFLSHLLLDELYSVQWSGLRLKLSKSAGSAFKLTSSRFIPNVFAYATLMFLTWLTLVDVGLIREPESLDGPPTASPTSPVDARPIRQAAEEWPERS